jgi:hypothetical protein
LNQAWEPKRLVGGFGITAFEDHIVVRQNTYPLDRSVKATVDSAGNLVTTHRHTLTRAAVLGPLSVFAPKATTHDYRELFFLVDGPTWAEEVRCNRDSQGAARSLAQAINVAARSVKVDAEARSQRIA